MGSLGWSDGGLSSMGSLGGSDGGLISMVSFFLAFFFGVVGIFLFFPAGEAPSAGLGGGGYFVDFFC